MENKKDTPELRKARRRNMALSIIVCLICGIALLMPMRGSEHQPYSFESAAGIDISAAREAYAESGDNDDLYQLALALCRQAYIESEANFNSAELCECGRELYRRAKAGDLDLETIGNTDDTTAMLDLLKEYGVTAMES